MDMKIKKNLIMKNSFYRYMIGAMMALTMVGCSDDPDSENYYTFTGQMMMEYLTDSEQFTEFAEICDRAGFSDMLSAYGSYTCFAPTNDAVETYLAENGYSSLDDLTDEDCDTIARTHLIENMYSVSEMNDGVLTTPNMNNRYLEISHGTDDDDNAVVIINKTAHVIFALQDDSVENGIMQPVTEVLESSNRMMPKVLEQNPKISLYYEAFEATGLLDSLYAYIDDSWDPDQYESYSYVSHVNKETANVPDEKKSGFTIFAVPDSILEEKYGITDLQGLYDKACEIYDEVYTDDATADYHSFDSLTNRANPLNRFMAYHVLTRDVIGSNYLTALDDIGLETSMKNPEDWYETLLPYTMLKVEKLTVYKYVGGDTRLNYYLNRRYDDIYSIRGAEITVSIESDYDQSGLNGIYFYIDDIVAFSTDTRDKVDNTRIRMDFSTLFPELMTCGIRQNGDPSYNDPDYDETGKYGKEYYFPDGYLKNVETTGYFIYRRPRNWYSCYQGDEMNMFGDYDITFKIPPVPYEGEYQLRLGFTALDTRGIGQVYFDDEPQGIPLDMTIDLSDPTIMGSDFRTDYTTNMTEAEKQEDRKALKNKGYYRDPTSAYRLDGTSHIIYANDASMFRLVLCTVHITDQEDHYLRCRNVSDNGSTEFMLDFFEVVPKSVYGVDDTAEQEDDM